VEPQRSSPVASVTPSTARANVGAAKKEKPMPIPYANSDSAGARALNSLGIFGRGALANQQPSFDVIDVQNNIPFVLTGSFVTLTAQLFSTGFATGSKGILTAMVAADVTSSGLSGSLELQMTDNGVPIPGTDVIQSYPIDAVGVTLRWETSIVMPPGPPALPHVYAVQARATGDGTLSVAVAHAHISLFGRSA
jgi:hypothetical protein